MPIILMPVKDPWEAQLISQQLPASSDIFFKSFLSSIRRLPWQQRKDMNINLILIS